jgi:hypothetical protein
MHGKQVNTSPEIKSVGKTRRYKLGGAQQVYAELMALSVI